MLMRTTWDHSLGTPDLEHNLPTIEEALLDTTYKDAGKTN
jgi:hypothetical protein